MRVGLIFQHGSADRNLSLQSSKVFNNSNYFYIATKFTETQNHFTEQQFFFETEPLCELFFNNSTGAANTKEKNNLLAFHITGSSKIRTRTSAERTGRAGEVQAEADQTTAEQQRPVGDTPPRLGHTFDKTFSAGGPAGRPHAGRSPQIHAGRVPAAVPAADDLQLPILTSRPAAARHKIAETSTAHSSCEAAEGKRNQHQKQQDSFC